MSDTIRIAPGHVSAATLLTTDSYVVSNWTRVSDMSSSVAWEVEQRDPPLQAHVPSLGVGGGQFTGSYACTFGFLKMTPLMRDYMENTLLSGNGIAAVTVYIANPRDPDVWGVYQGQLVSPLQIGGDFGYFDENTTHEMGYRFNRGIKQTINVLASGSAALLSGGNYIILS